MATIRQYLAYQSWQAPACLRFLHQILLEFLLIFSPFEFCRSRFSSDRGKTTANPAGLARILTMSGRKNARQNRVRILHRMPRDDHRSSASQQKCDLLSRSTNGRPYGVTARLLLQAGVHSVHPPFFILHYDSGVDRVHPQLITLHS